MQTTQDIPSLKSFAELQQAHTDEFVKMTEAVKDFLQARYPDKDFYGPAEIIEDTKSAILSAGRLIDIVKRNKELEAEVERLKAELAAIPRLIDDNGTIRPVYPHTVGAESVTIGWSVCDKTVNEALEREAKEVPGKQHIETAAIRYADSYAAKPDSESGAKPDFENYSWKPVLAPEKHPFDSGLVAVHGIHIEAWTSTEYYREFTSHFQRLHYTVKPPCEVNVRADWKDSYVKNAWKPL